MISLMCERLRPVDRTLPAVVAIIMAASISVASMALGLVVLDVMQGAPVCVRHG